MRAVRSVTGITMEGGGLQIRGERGGGRKRYWFTIVYYTTIIIMYYCKLTILQHAKISTFTIPTMTCDSVQCPIMIWLTHLKYRFWFFSFNKLCKRKRILFITIRGSWINIQSASTSIRCTLTTHIVLYVILQAGSRCSLFRNNIRVAATAYLYLHSLELQVLMAIFLHLKHFLTSSCSS